MPKPPRPKWWITAVDSAPNAVVFLHGGDSLGRYSEKTAKIRSNKGVPQQRCNCPYKLEIQNFNLAKLMNDAHILVT